MVTFTLVVAGADVRWSISRFSPCGHADEILATNTARNSPVTGRNWGNMVEVLRSTYSTIRATPSDTARYVRTEIRKLKNPKEPGFTKNDRSASRPRRLSCLPTWRSPLPQTRFGVVTDASCPACVRSDVPGLCP